MAFHQILAHCSTTLPHMTWCYVILGLCIALYCSVLSFMILLWNAMVRFASFCNDMLRYVMTHHAIAFSKWYELKLEWAVMCSRIPVPYHISWFANASHVVIVCWTELCKFTFQSQRQNVTNQYLSSSLMQRRLWACTVLSKHAQSQPMWCML